MNNVSKYTNTYTIHIHKLITIGFPSMVNADRTIDADFYRLLRCYIYMYEPIQLAVSVFCITLNDKQLDSDFINKIFGKNSILALPIE